MRLSGWALNAFLILRLLLPLLLMAALIAAVAGGWWYLRERREARLAAMIEEYGPTTREEVEAGRRVAIAAPRPPLTATEIAQLARIGELAAMPPLRPLPPTLQRLEAPIQITGLLAAERAGVALVRDSARHYALLDLGTGEVIARGEGRQTDSISPNGRVIGVAVAPGTELRDAVTGEALMTLPGVAPYQVRWVGGVGLMHFVADRKIVGGERLVFRDFATGLESSLYLPLGRDDMPGVVPLPGQRDRFALLQDGQWTEMTLTRSAAGWVANTIGSRAWSGWHSRDDINLSADGRYHVSLVGGSKLVVVDIAAGAERVVNLGEFVVTAPVFVADPDQVLLRGSIRVRSGPPQSVAFLYSLTSGLMAQVPAAELPERLFFLRALGVVATFDDALRPVTLPAGTVPADVGLVLALADPQLQAPEAPRPPPPESPPPVSADAVARLVQGARLVGVGVYEARREPPPPRNERAEALRDARMLSAIEAHDYETVRAIQRERKPEVEPVGSVRVRVLRTKQPTVLVLSSYEAVRWVVSVDPGADVRGILLSGHRAASVIGTALPVHRIGPAYAYGNGARRQALDDELRHLTGRTVEEFQGEYAGDNFMLVE